jgi:hypothetical protein
LVGQRAEAPGVPELRRPAAARIQDGEPLPGARGNLGGLALVLVRDVDGELEVARVRGHGDAESARGERQIFTDDVSARRNLDRPRQEEAARRLAQLFAPEAEAAGRSRQAGDGR